MRRVGEILALNADLCATVLVQGEMSKASLIARHKEMIDADKASILLGVTSFSEGIDLPGDYCTAVVIPRIPFAVPSTPMEKSRLDWINRSGGHSFSDYTLPMASIRFTQMVGRLIRTERDAGSIIVLDPRICTKAYGNLLLQNIPGFMIQRFSSAALKE
jgi:ATP-dependent DNA helicase DinG